MSEEEVYIIVEYNVIGYSTDSNNAKKICDTLNCNNNYNYYYKKIKNIDNIINIENNQNHVKTNDEMLDIIHKWDNVELNSNYVNKNIKYNILSDDKMKKIGFTNRCNDNWYFHKIFEEEISFNVTIPKNNEDIRIDVLDEDFLQPYDYQHILKDNPNHQYALKVMNFVEKWMKYLKDNNVLIGHEYGDYI